MCQKLFAMIKDSGLLPAAPGAPAAVGGPERPAAERSPEPLQPSTSEEDQVINLYRGALPRTAPTTSSKPLLAQAQQDLEAARRERAAAVNKERTAQQLVDKIADLPHTSFGGHVDLAGTERQGGYYGGASSSSYGGASFADDTADPQAFRQAVSKKWGLEYRDPSRFQPTLEAFVEGAIYAEMIKAQVALDAQGPGHGVGGYKRSTRAAGFDDVPGGVDPSRHGSSYQRTADGGAGGQASKGTKPQPDKRPRKRGGAGTGGGGGGGGGKAGRR